MSVPNTSRPMGWSHIVRLGLVQACLGAMVVLATSTLNRIMVVELALPALVPGLLVGFHYAIQMVRPRMGFGADRGRRCTPWMIGGVVTLALGGTLAAWGTIPLSRSLPTPVPRRRRRRLRSTAIALGILTAISLVGLALALGVGSEPLVKPTPHATSSAASASAAKQ